MDAQINTMLYFHRDKDENSELEEEATTLGWTNSRDLLYVGYEIGMKVNITNKDYVKTRVLEINGVDVSDKAIYI